MSTMANTNTTLTGERADLFQALANARHFLRFTTQNLTVHAIDAEKGLVLIKGAVPGPKGGVVFIKTAVKSGE